MIALISLAVCGVIRFAADSLAIVFSAWSNLDAAIVVALITGCISIVTVIGGGIVNNVLSYRQRRGEYLRLHREPAYQMLIEIVYKILAKTKNNEQYGPDEMFRDKNEFNQALTLWGSSKAIRLWDKWRLASVGQNLKPAELLFTMEEVLIQLRKDKSQTGGIRKGDLLKLFINDIESLSK